MQTGARTTDDVAAWSQLLRGNWETLAQSPFRDYFIASHRGCDDPKIWRAQAGYDAAVVLHELAPEALARLDVLEIGCGVGRLAAAIAPRVKSYTGFDIAPGMVAEAERREARLRNARFFVGEGGSVPAGARDRRYGLAFAMAVFVHCPEPVIAALVVDACALLAPGGELRFQLRADTSDPSGIRPFTGSTLAHAPPVLPSAPPRADEVDGMRAVEQLLDGRYYMGHAFRFDAVEPFLRALVPGARLRVLRFDPHHIYVDLRPAP